MFLKKEDKDMVPAVEMKCTYEAGSSLASTKTLLSGASILQEMQKRRQAHNNVRNAFILSKFT
jgi:hypothetical protein